MTCGRLPKYGNAFTKTGGPDIAITGMIKNVIFSGAHRRRHAAFYLRPKRTHLPYFSICS